MMERQKFGPLPGHVYRNHGGGKFRCLRCLGNPYDAVMQNTASGWILRAYGCGVYPNGTIDWDYSTDGYFPEGGSAMAGFFVYDRNGRLSGRHKRLEAAIAQAKQLAQRTGDFADVERCKGQRRRFFANGEEDCLC